MERSKQKTEYIIIKALTNSSWDKVDFAIIHLTNEMIANLQQRLMAIQQFKNDATFHAIAFWDSPEGYYCNTSRHLFTETILKAGEDWAYIKLNSEELKTLSMPENSLEAHQLLISGSGCANFKAYSKYTIEEYWTECFSIEHILDIKTEVPNDSS